MSLMKYLRACAVCQTYFPPTEWLCTMCWKAMEREYLCSENSYRVERTLPHLRLMDWHEDNHQLIKYFVNSLKQGGPDFIFKRLGLEMFSRFLQFNFWNKEILPVFVPAPSRTKIREDHAFKLAEALSFYFGGKLKELLSRKNSCKAQKSKSKQKRSLIQMESKTFPKDETFVFVDDVLTTGSTARAAFQALNKPQNFFVFTLVWKKPVQDDLLL